MMIKPVYTIPENAPMKFYRFLVKFGLFIGIAIDGWNLASGLGARNLHWLDAIILLAHIVLLLLAKEGLRDMEWSGVRFLYAAVLLSFGYKLFFLLVFLAFAPPNLPIEAVSGTISNSIIFLTYWIYFSKRRLLFAPSPIPRKEDTCAVPPVSHPFSSPSGPSESSAPDLCPEMSPEVDSSDLPLLNRLARSAEKRLNATEAEMRFASDIAAGIYTVDMIPPSMDAKKVLELSDYYTAERLNIVELSSVSDFRPSSQPDKDSFASSRNHKWRKRFLSWVPAACVLLLFIVLCVYSFYANSLSFDISDDAATGDNRSSPSYAVDYKTSYVGSVNSDFVHHTPCRHADNILEKNRVYYENVSDAQADGRVKCSECFP